MTRRRASRGARGGAALGSRLRAALLEHAEGVHRLGPPAAEAALAAAERRLGGPLPRGLRGLLGRWNGLELFHEGTVVGGVGAEAVGGDLVERTRAAREAGLLPAGALAIGETAGGELLLLEPAEGATEPRVLVQEEGGVELLPMGSSLGTFLEAVVARESLLVDRDGEFRDGLFGDDGELLPEVEVKAARRAASADPQAPGRRLALGRALVRRGRPGEAEEELRRAVSLEPRLGWAWYDLGKLLARRGRAAEAIGCFSEAAEAQAAYEHAGFFAASGARVAVAAGDAAEAARLRARALALDPDVGRRLRDAAAHQLEAGERDEARELVAVAAAVLPADLPTLDLARRLGR